MELAPAKTLDLSALRVVFSTGSPLLPEDYDWVYSEGAPNVLLGSIAGGTDICGCFVGATPLLPGRRGEIQCRFLGVDAVAYGDDGNPGGVRIGTAEIYRQVETEAAVKDSLVIGRQIDGDVEVVLLVVPAEGESLGEELVKRLKTRIREGASPRHVPRHVITVPDIPYTRSGKKVELAVARLINGSARSDNRDALANPEALGQIEGVLKELNLLTL